MYEPTIAAVPFALATAVLVVLTAALVLRAEGGLGKALLVWTIGGTLWSLAAMMRVLAVDPAHEFVWYTLRMLGIEVAGIGFFVVTVLYTDRERWLSTTKLGILVAFAAVTQALAWTNDAHQLVYAAVETDAPPPLSVVFVPGPWFWLHATVTYCLVLTGAYFIAVRFMRARQKGPYRGQTAMILASVVAVVVPSILYLTDVTTLDFTPVGGAVSASVVIVALYRYRLLDISPIAREVVVESMDTAMTVVDANDRVIDANERAAAVFEVPVDGMVGEPLSALLADYPEVLEMVTDSGETEETVSVTVDGDQRHYDVTTSAIRDSTGGSVGQVLLFSDVSSQVKQRAELRAQKETLERQNERLDRFASVISHDLRNPLGIAQTYVDFAENTGDPEDFDAVREALDRMDEMVEDMLTMARTGATVEEQSEIPLANVASRAWETTRTDGATLAVAVPDGHKVSADPDLLQSVFENLFRNSVEHGSTSHADADARQDSGDRQPKTDGAKTLVEVRVGVLDDADGFFVQDDGQGIPPEQREQIFDHGYTTGGDGIGIGLAIVDDIVEAHGWEARVTESEEGGARFVFET